MHLNRAVCLALALVFACALAAGARSDLVEPAAQSRLLDASLFSSTKAKQTFLEEASRQPLTHFGRWRGFAKTTGLQNSKMKMMRRLMQNPNSNRTNPKPVPSRPPLLPRPRSPPTPSRGSNPPRPPRTTTPPRSSPASRQQDSRNFLNGGNDRPDRTPRQSNMVSINDRLRRDATIRN